MADNFNYDDTILVGLETESRTLVYDTLILAGFAAEPKTQLHDVMLIIGSTRDFPKSVTILAGQFAVDRPGLVGSFARKSRIY